MNILNETNQSKETQQTRPIFLIILLVLIIVFAVVWYRKNNLFSFTPSFNTSEPMAVKPINIDFTFLTSPDSELQALEAFPDYPAFREATGTEVEPGRINPFLPPSGVRTSTPKAQ